MSDKATQATSEAGPAIWAESPGRTRIPDPRTELM